MKNKPNLIKIVLIAAVVLLTLALGACNRPKTTTPVETPTLNVPINTVVVEDEAEDEESVSDTIEIITTEEPEEVEEVEEPVATEEPTEAPEPTATVVEVPKITVPQTYTLMKDEFPYCIARRFDVNISELMSLNGLVGGQSYYEGMVLKIPQDSSWDESAHGSRSLRAHPVVYTVQVGDSIYSIACKFGDVSPEQIAAKNSLKEPYSLTIGMELNIP